MFAAVFFGLVLAAVGLGLQAEGRRAALMATVVTAVAMLFWATQAVFAASAVHSILFTALAGLLGAALRGNACVRPRGTAGNEAKPPARGSRSAAGEL